MFSIPIWVALEIGLPPVQTGSRNYCYSYNRYNLGVHRSGAFLALVGFFVALIFVHRGWRVTRAAWRRGLLSPPCPCASLALPPQRPAPPQ